MLCNKENLKYDQLDQLRQLIDENYRYRMYLDGLPNVSITYNYNVANPEGKPDG